MASPNPEAAHAGLAVPPASPARLDLLSFGEVMLRFDPGEARIARTRNFHVWEGGGEYNVARGLRRCFGLRSGIVTALVDNPVGRLVEDLILQGGVDTIHLHWQPFDGLGQQARNGIYFLERGFGLRGALGMMDRGHTAIAQLQPGDIDWDAIFSAPNAPRWFHTGGIMAGLSSAAAALVTQALQSAQRHGVIVSFDCNYRPSLWSARGGRAASIAVNRALMPFVDLLFGHEGDVATAGDAMHAAPTHTLETFTAMATRLNADFPNLKVIATTARKVISANRNHWSGFAFAQGQAYQGIAFPDLDILDRVGAGDSFAAGLIFGLLSGKGLAWSLDCGIAHGALTMTTPGDSSMAALAEVERLMHGGSAAVQR
jgi:2-dehydro-3-deoxygluconokinase